MRVVVADDAVILREGLARLLTETGFEVVGLAGDADELLDQVAAHSPDVAIVDIRMPPTHTDEGLRAAREIRERHPGTGVLVLSQYIEADYALDLLSESAEGVGYLLKDRVSDVAEFASAVRRVGEGGTALDPAVIAASVRRVGAGGSVLDPVVVSQLVDRRRVDDPLAGLTPREREVLAQMAEGRSNKAIAERLSVTEHTIEKHVKNIFQTLRLASSLDDHRRVLAVVTFLNAR